MLPLGFEQSTGAASNARRSAVTHAVAGKAARLGSPARRS